MISTHYNPRIMAIKNPFVRQLYKHFWRDVHTNNLGWFGTITGLPGEGKSEKALSLAAFQDMDFSEDTLEFKYFFQGSKFLKFVNEANKYDWGIWDETGVTFSSKKWNTLSNIVCEDTVQTMRYKKLGIIFVTQNIGFIDNRARQLMRWFTEIKRFESDPPRWKLHKIRMDQRRNKIMFPYPRMKINGRIHKLKMINVNGRLPLPIRNKFDEIHSAWKDELLKKHLKIVEKIERDESPMDIWEMIEYVQKNKEKFEKRIGRKSTLGGFDQELIMLEFGIGENRAKQIIKFLHRESIKK